MKDSLKMLEIDKDVSGALFLKIFDGMSGEFAYYELSVDKNERPEDYRFLLFNTALEKQENGNVEAVFGKTIKEIFPNVEQSWIDKLGGAIQANEATRFTNFNTNTKSYYHVNSFSKGGNKFVMIIDDFKRERNSIEELLFQNDEKEKRADELAFANKELAFQNEEKDKRAHELDIANKELAFQIEEKDKRADELAIANKELAFQNEEKDKRANELALANKELAFQDEEKAKREAELAIANKELAFQNQEKTKRADELVLANKELAFQNELTKNRIETESIAKELRQFIETANAPIFGIDSKGLVNEWNQTSEKITGFKKEDVLGENLVETYITEDYRDAVKQVLDNALKGKETANYEFPLFTKDGKRVMVLLNSSTRRNADGQIIGVLGVGQDISEIDKLRTESESVAKELRQFIETANAPIFGIDSKGLVNEWNQTSEKITGFKKQEVLGKDLVETYITEDYRDAVEKVLDNALTGKETANYEFPLFTKDGKRVMVLLNSSTRRNGRGEIIGVLGVGQDISEIDKLRTESESVAKELRQFIETANAPIFGIDSKGLVNEWNQTSEKITGFKKEDVLGENLVETYITEDYRDAVKQVLDNALKGKETANYEFPLFTKDGKRVMVLLNSSTRRNADGEIVGVLGVGQDISEIDKLRTESESVAKELRQFIETANAPIFGIDSKGLVNEWNETSEKITGFKKGEVLGKDLVETYITEDYRDAVKQVLDNALKGKETANYEFPLFTKDGKRVMVLLNSSTRRNADGEIVGVLGVGQDISEIDKLRTESESVAKELRQFIETANAPIFGIDSKGLVNEWNQTSEKITGFKKGEVLGKDLVETYITEDYRDAVKKVLDNALRGTETTNYEFPLFTKDDKRVMVLLNSSTRRNADGEIVGVLGVGQDISEIDKLRTESESVAKELRQFIETANAPIFGIDSKGLVNEWNQTSEKITGFKKGEVLGKDLVETYITEDYRDAVKKVLDNALRGTETTNYEFPLFTKDDKRVMVLLNSSTRRNADGEIVGVLGVGQDISEIDKLRTESESVAKELRQFIETANAPIFGIDSKGLVNEWNETSEKITGFKKGEVLGKDLVETYITEDYRDAVKQVLDNALKGKETANYEFPLFTSNGKRVMVLLNSSTRRNVKGEIVGVLGVGQDITILNEYKENLEYKVKNRTQELAFQNDEKDKRAAELAIANKELAFQNDEKEKRAVELIIANKELEFQNNEKGKRALELVYAKEKAEESDYLKTAFLANMSHEIRTPMNGILGFSELLKTPNLSGEKQQDYIRIIEKSGHRMLNTINDIISISKIESGLMELDISESNVNEQIEYIHTFFKPEMASKELKFFTHNDLPFELAFIKTDREKIFAILTNLVKNAIKFTEIGSIEIGYIQKEGYLEFYVKDSGVGIDDDRKVAIFERFIQADISDSRAYEGAGLGLSISKAFVQMLGGELRVESEKGKGSVFYFTIPYIKNQQQKMEVETDIPIDTQGKNLKILIVEDDEISDLLLSIRLNKISREIVHASNGLEAVEICRKNPDIDLILMDIKMPLMDGHQAAQEIRAFNKDIIIIAQTAHAFEGDKEKAIAAGCNEYLSKPLVIKEVISLIQHYFIN